ncbi:MAG: SAM-dependent methyltransferase [Acidobacteria bacterium]|nr:SAM-dependent methyltransferase [Acidobacteriota bacterium]
MTPDADTAVPASFRDPSGHVFTQGGRLRRQVNAVYAPHYDRLIGSGLYAALVGRRLLVPHVEVDGPRPPGAHRILEPEPVPFVSYPFEWSFGQLKAAALATLDIHRAALDAGMILKDASAYNIQFRGAEPTLIDTLSFDTWSEGAPWIAYRQFCQHFLAPLALMSATDGRLGALSRVFIDGPPLDLAARLLPFASRLKPALLVHLHLHARAQARRGHEALRSPGNGDAPVRAAKFTRQSMLGLVEHLRGAVGGLTHTPVRGAWADYYGRTNYSPEAMAEKSRIVAAMLARARPATAWDLGANTGAFSRLAAEAGAYTIAFDGDHDAVELHVDACRARGEQRILPLVMDLTNPTGRIGWNHAERASLSDRGPADVVLALGLIHHLALANQVPFGMIAAFLAGLGRTLIVEFVAPTDSQVIGMLSRMPTLREGYALEPFARAFEELFVVDEVAPIAGTERRLYLMRRKAAA